MRRLLLTAALLCLLSACEKRPSVPAEVQKTDAPDQEMWNFTVRATDCGMLQALIQAGHMRRFSGRGLALFDQGVHIDFFGREGEHVSTLTAEGGELDDATGNVKVSGNVAVVSDSGFTLYSELLFYHKEENRLFSNVDVMVTTVDGDTLRGVGFESDTQMNQWRILKPHKGVAHKGADLSLPKRRTQNRPDAQDSLKTEP